MNGFLSFLISKSSHLAFTVFFIGVPVLHVYAVDHLDWNLLHPLDQSPRISLISIPLGEKRLFDNSSIPFVTFFRTILNLTLTLILKCLNLLILFRVEYTFLITGVVEAVHDIFHSLFRVAHSVKFYIFSQVLLHVIPFRPQYLCFKSVCIHRSIVAGYQYEKLLMGCTNLALNVDGILLD